MMFTQLLLILILATLIVIARSLLPIARNARRMLLKSGREYVIGFGPTIVKAGAQAVFTALPKSPFSGTRLIVPGSIANNFAVADIMVGASSQKISANAIPAAAFSELAVGVDLGLQTSAKDEEIQLFVANTTDVDQLFSGALIGRCDQYGTEVAHAQLAPVAS